MLSYANTSISELFNNFALNTTFDFSLQFITNLKFIFLILIYYVNVIAFLFSEYYSAFFKPV